MSLPLSRSVCRSCLSESNNASMMSINEVSRENSKAGLLDMLVFLDCIQINESENWPSSICQTCVSKLLVAYEFKLTCAQATAALTQLLPLSSSDTFNLQSQPVDIQVVYRDHEYEIPAIPAELCLDMPATSSFQEDLLASIVSQPVENVEVINKVENITGIKSYPCNLCTRSYSRIHGLRYHLKKHSKKRTYLCTVCGKCFLSPGGLWQHSKLHTVQRPYSCMWCEKAYRSMQSLRQHQRVAHSDNRYSHSCAECGKLFTTKSSLIEHIKIHRAQRDYRCPDCPKTYTRASYLRLHRRVHTGEERPKPFKCDFKSCDRVFPTKYSVKVHILYAHSDERPHRCGICSKCFATAGGLRIHKETHSGKLVTCSLCGRQLANNQVLQRHLRRHDASDKVAETVVLEPGNEF